MVTMTVPAPTLRDRLIAIARRPLSYWQRLAIAVFYAAVAALIVHSWVADQLTLHANDALTVGDPAYARHLYDRALWVDPRCRSAAEGWMLATVELRQPGSDALAIRFATKYLAEDPDAFEVRRLRAVSEVHVRALVDAAQDFTFVARARNGIGDWEFALLSAQRAKLTNLAADARRNLRALDPHDSMLERLK